MSKMDNLRAMREARYEAARAGKPATSPATRPPVAPADAAVPARAKPAKKAVAAPAPAGGIEAPCGHRNMSGRTCTREHGHAAKSHRYS